MNTQNEKQLTRGCGVLMPVSSLPSAYGIGTIGRAAYDFVDLLVDLKFRYWQILPIGPTSFGNSPYQALSAFAGNNYYIDLDELVTALESRSISLDTLKTSLIKLDKLLSIIYAGNFDCLKACLPE